MARFELIEENNSILTEQVKGMLVGVNKQWAEKNYDVISGLDEKTANAVDKCSNSLNWLNLLTEEEVKRPVNIVILEFLNKRPRVSRERVKETLKLMGTVKKARDTNVNQNIDIK